MQTTRAFIVSVSLPVESLQLLDQVAADMQATLLDAGFEVTKVDPWSNHSQGGQASETLPGGFPV